MIKILVITPFARDANSFWRCVGPLSYLAQYSKGAIQINVMPEKEPIAWDKVIGHDIVFMHRPCRPDDVTVMQIARTLNVPVWIDYDDWLFDLPVWNRGRGIYNNPVVQNAMAQCLATADVITCTTSALYKKFKQVNDNVVIVPNAYRSDLFPYRAETPPERKNLIMWRGSDTHDGDLNSVVDAFAKIKHKIQFIGGVNWQVLSTMDPKNYEAMGAQDNLIFQRYIYNLAPKVVIFPLVDCFFNHCKSNIAYIEALHAGALCVAPNMPEWKKPGVIGYKPHDPDSFLQAINEAMSLDSVVHANLVKHAYDEMKTMYDIKGVNVIRSSIINAMMDVQFKRNKRDPFDQLTASWAIAKLKQNEVDNPNKEEQNILRHENA